MSGRRTIAGWLACAGACLLCGCGSAGKPSLEVSAAASLRAAFGLYAQQIDFAAVHYSFAGSDALAAQIEQGARPDVFASANTELAAQLYSRHLVEMPVDFASNVLVLAVPASSRIGSLADLLRPGVTLAVGSPNVPVGRYTETALSRLPAAQRRRLQAHVRDREPDVTGIVGKLLAGAIDAGFVYRTDVLATRGALRSIPLPASLQPRVDYAAAVVRGGAHARSARAFVAGLLGSNGRADLQQSGFLPPSR